MSLVTTRLGDLDEEKLVVKTHEQNCGNAIEVVREWYLGEEMVRRDCWVTIKRGHVLTAEKGM